MLLRKSASLTS